VSAGDTPLSELPKRIGKADIVFEAVGPAWVAFGALATLAPNGVFILSGIPGGDAQIEIGLDRIMRDIVLKNQVLLGTVNASRGAFEAAVRQLEQFMGLFPAALQGLITHRVKLEDAPELLHRPAGIKQVVQVAA
jgi:threonine dehydrogenase-like Zn-dependent dehydrogenase